MTTRCLVITFGAYTPDMMMSQHFLLSAKARTLSLAKVMRLTDEEAYETFKAVRCSRRKRAGGMSCLDPLASRARA